MNTNARIELIMVAVRPVGVMPSPSEKICGAMHIPPPKNPATSAHQKVLPMVSPFSSVKLNSQRSITLLNPTIHRLKKNVFLFFGSFVLRFLAMLLFASFIPSAHRLIMLLFKVQRYLFSRKRPLSHEKKVTAAAKSAKLFYVS